MAGELLHAMGVDIDPHEKVFRLSMWQCQVVEITKLEHIIMELKQSIIYELKSILQSYNDSIMKVAKNDIEATRL